MPKHGPATEDAVYRQCITQIVNASGGAINSTDAKALLKNLNAIKKLTYASMGGTGVSYAGIKSALPSILAKNLDQIRIGRLQKAVQIQMQKEANASKDVKILTTPKAKDQFKNMMDTLFGSWSNADGGRYSTDTIMADNVGHALTDIETGLRQQGVFDMFTEGIDEPLVAEELAQLNTTGGKPGMTGNKDAQKIAQVIHNQFAKLLKQSERAGIFIPKIQAYTCTQSHDADVIHKAGFEKWRDDIMPALNKFETFGTNPPEKWEEILNNHYLNIVTGKHLDYDKGISDNGIDTSWNKAPGTNLALKAAAKRSLHFISTKAAYDYQRTYGARTFREQILTSAASIARRTALAQEWGVNAEGAMQRMFNKILMNAREQVDLDTIAAIDQSSSRVRAANLVGNATSAIAEILGRTRTPVQRNFWYSALTWAQTLRNTASLGMTTISSQSDLVNLVGHLSTIKGQVNPITNMVKVATAYYTPQSSKYDDIGRICGLMSDAMRKQMIDDRYGSMTTTNVQRGISNFFFRWVGLHWHDQRIRNVSAVLIAEHFGSIAHLDHASLPSEAKTFLGRYQINENEWNLMRDHVATGGDGSKFLTPVASDNIPDIDLINMLPPGKPPIVENVEIVRDGLRSRFSAMFTDAANHTVPRAGGRERMIMYQGTSPSSLTGVALRLCMQYKTFPITMMTKVLNRNIYGQHFKGSMPTAMSLGFQLGLATLLGAGIYALKETLLGQTPASPDTTKGAKALFVKAVTQGGGLGYAGDLLLPNDVKEGALTNFAHGFLGPVGGDIFDTGDAITKYVSGNEKGAAFAKEIAQTATGYVPFSNHIATKYLFNYGLKYPFLNWIDSSNKKVYTDKKQEGMAKDKGTRFFLPVAAGAKTLSPSTVNMLSKQADQKKAAN